MRPNQTCLSNRFFLNEINFPQNLKDPISLKISREKNRINARKTCSFKYVRRNLTEQLVGVDRHLECSFVLLFEFHSYNFKSNRKAKKGRL